MNRLSLALLVGAPVLVSCGNTTPPTITQLNLDRPTDVAFACYGDLRLTGGTRKGDAKDPVQVSAQPTESCEAWSRDPAVVPLGQENIDGAIALRTPQWFGLILQPTAGTVALAQFDAKAPSAFTGGDTQFGSADVNVLDADLLTPGKNSLAIADQPVAIATDHLGCFAVTANAGTCDLSTIELGSVLDRDPATPPQLARIDVTIGAGAMAKPILSRPAALVAAPQTTRIGNACPATPTGLAYIAYPSCNLVAGVDLATGQVKVAIDLSSGAPQVKTDAALDAISCPMECVRGGVALPAGAPHTGKRPVALAVERDYARDTALQRQTKDDAGVVSDPVPPTGRPLPLPTSRLVIGSDNDNQVTVIDLASADVDPVPTATPPRQVALQDPTGKLGLTAVALSPVVAQRLTFDTEFTWSYLDLNGATQTLTTALSGDVDRADAFGPASGASVAQYVYAVATDGTVRVAEVKNLNAECDTQVDLRALQIAGAPAVDAQQCMPVGLPRRPGARGPGIELPHHAAPLSVAFVTGRHAITTSDSDPSATSESPINLAGHFALISAANGSVYVANVADDGNRISAAGAIPDDRFVSGAPARTAPVLHIAHQLRDFVVDRGRKVGVTERTVNNEAIQKPNCLDSGSAGDPSIGAGFGPPHITAMPSRITTGGPVSDVKLLSQADTKASLLPNLQQVTCVDGFESVPIDPPPTDKTSYVGLPISSLMVRAQADPQRLDRAGFGLTVPEFPELRALHADETWSLTWEGTLSLDGSSSAVDGPPVRHGVLRPDYGLRLVDDALPFCEMGVEPFDIVELRGCSRSNGDADCPAGYTCYVHADSKVGSGSCLLKSEASSLATACRDFLISKRRYSVKATRVAFPQEGAVGAGQLQLVPRTHALRTTPVDGCSSDAQCGALADYAAQLVDNTHPRLSTAKDAHVIKVGDAEQSLWKCQLDATRAPPGGVAGAKRCVLSCRTDVDCDAGESCSAGVCVEGVVPPPACATAVQAYDVRASDAFVVIGTDSGYVHPWVAAKPLTGPTTQCVRRTGDGVERFLGRVPLTAPACDGSGTSPNPCSTTVAHSELAPRYQAGSDTCALDPGYVQPFLRERTDVPAIRFSNQGMTLTVVDPYTPGDAACINDRGGVPGAQGAKIPIAFAGYQILFHQTNGYAAMAMPLVAPVFPVKVLRGPTDSIWVMDAGDTLSSVTASTRGKVYRIESSALDVVNIVK